jgi:hypothetical protein
MKHVLLGLTLALLVPAVAAQDETVDTAHWVKLSTGDAFTFEAPAGTVEYRDGMPIDSFAQSYRGPGFTLSFDYGAYSNDLRNQKALPAYHAEEIVIDGRKGVLITGPGRNLWGCHDTVTAAYVVVRHEGLFGAAIRFQIDGCAATPEGIATLHAIFRTIRFTAR